MAKSLRWQLVRDALAFQLKVLLDALRDLVLSPLSLLAALVDLLFAGSRKPALFYAVMRLGERSEHWIDLWSAGARSDAGAAEDPAMNVDGLLARVETLVRDPAAGKKNAQVLKRWARMRLNKSRREMGDGRPE